MGFHFRLRLKRSLWLHEITYIALFMYISHLALSSTISLTVFHLAGGSPRKLTGTVQNHFFK